MAMLQGRLREVNRGSLIRYDHRHHVWKSYSPLPDMPSLETRVCAIHHPKFRESRGILA
jgi:hypothetical protein